MSDFLIQDGQTLVAQGDSITDCGRRDSIAPYGGGYVNAFRQAIMALYPDRNITIINKGISGDTVPGLKERWDDDVVRHQPDWVSILIGINDLHRFLFNPDANLKIPVDMYRENYDWVLQRTAEKTSARLVLLDPFYISLSSCDTNRRQVLDLIPEYIQVVHDMAAKYDALLVPMHDIYQKHLTYREADFFCPEPVHPNQAGHTVMALEMLRTLGGL